MTILQRITTEYIEAEDRVRLSGVSPSGEAVSLWVTQRLLSRLLKVILNWTAEGENAQQALKNAFAQQAARADLKLQLSVPAQPIAVLVNTIDISQTVDALTLVFHCSDGPAGQLTLQAVDGRSFAGFDEVLWAIGRKPNTAELELGAAGVARDAAGFVTGQLLPVNGGFVMN